MAKSSWYIRESVAIAERVLRDASEELNKMRGNDVLSWDEVVRIESVLAEVERLTLSVALLVNVVDVRNSVKEVN